MVLEENMGNDARLVFMVPADLKNRLEKTAKEKGHTLTYVMRTLLANWVNENRPGPGRKPKRVAV